MDASDLQEELIAAFPPGIEAILDWDEDPGKLLGVCAQVLYDHGTTQVDQLRLELNPATVVKKLTDWEQSMGLDQTSIARLGSVPQRRQQLISRLREYGPPTLAAIRAVIQPLFQYKDPAEIVILEVNRTMAREMHTYRWKGSLLLSKAAQVCLIRADDGMIVNQAGVQLDLTLDTPNLETLSVTLRSPQNDRVITKDRMGLGAYKGILRVYCKEMAGVLMDGYFTIEVVAEGGGTLSQANLFVEGTGRDERWQSGRGGLPFHFGVVAEEDKLGNQGPYDLKAAQDAIARFNYARNEAGLVLRSRGPGKLAPGQFAAIPDDPNSIPSMCIPG